MVRRGGGGRRAASRSSRAASSGGGSTTAAQAAGTAAAAARGRRPAPTTTPPAALARLTITPRNGSDGQSGHHAGHRAGRRRHGEHGEPAQRRRQAGRRHVQRRPDQPGPRPSRSATTRATRWPRSAANADGKTTRSTSAFSTVTPRTFTLPYLFPGGSGGPKTVGVGQPIQVRFDEPIADKAAAEKALVVTTNPHGRRRLALVQRPARCTGARSTTGRPAPRSRVKANVYGVSVGDGIYGQQDVSSSFTIGASKIFTINDKTHTGVDHGSTARPPGPCR